MMQSVFIPQEIFHCRLKFKKQTFSRSESVANTETSGTALTPEHSSPNCVTKWGVSGFNGQANKIENFELSPMDPGPCSRVHCTHPIRGISASKQGKGTGIRGSAYCSASLCATDYDHHKCQALMQSTNSCNVKNIMHIAVILLYILCLIWSKFLEQ